MHLGHANMAKRRGFSSVEEHDQHIINKWNSKVDKHDTVFILGDLTMEKDKFYHYLDQLNGFKKVVLGNHDRPNHIPKLLEHVNSVCSSHKEAGAVFTHIPIHESELGRFGKNVHGHIHSNVITKPLKLFGIKILDRVDRRYICVSCEQVDYTPKTFEELGLTKKRI